MPLSTEASAAAGPSAPAVHSRIPVCICGQDLDIVPQRHCPRCGIAQRVQFLAAAA